MNNTQQLFEIQITQNGESFLLTKQTRSPFVKSDVFALGDYKRSMVTLLGGVGVVLDSANMFFDCDLLEDTKVIHHTPLGKIQKSPLDFTPKEVKEPTFMQKLLAFFKREAREEEILPSTSFICLQDGDLYHFIGALCEDTHTVSFDVNTETSQVVAKINTTAYPCPHDSLLFDILEMQGSADYIIETFYSLVQKLYKRQPKSSPVMDTVEISLEDCKRAETIEILNGLSSYTLTLVTPQNDDFSMSSYIQQSESAVSNLLANTSENIFPIAVISPFVCERNSVEHELFKNDLVKKPNGKPFEFSKFGKTFCVFDIFSKSFKGYLARQMDILLGMGFCGFKFCNLDILPLAIKEGKSQGETIKTAYATLLEFSSDKFTIAEGAYSAISSGMFDFYVQGESVSPVAKMPNNGENVAPTSALDWDFAGFESVIVNFENNKKFPSALPITVDCDLLKLDPLLFDLCVSANLLACKAFGVANPSKEAMLRLADFDFLKSANVDEIIHIDNGRFAVVFTLEKQTSVCFFNFTPSDWISEDFNIPALSFTFQE